MKEMTRTVITVLVFILALISLSALSVGSVNAQQGLFNQVETWLQNIPCGSELFLNTGTQNSVVISYYDVNNTTALDCLAQMEGDLGVHALGPQIEGGIYTTYVFGTNP